MAEVVTSGAAYLTAADLIDLCGDAALVADWAAPAGTARPTRRAVLDPLSPAGRVVAAALLAATGELLAAVQAGGRYAPADLPLLTGAAAAHLKAVVGGLALWRLALRKNPADADPDKVPAARAALDAKGRLAAGEDVFGLAATIAAGGGMSVAPLTDPANTTGRTVREAFRYFGRRADGRRGFDPTYDRRG